MSESTPVATAEPEPEPVVAVPVVESSNDQQEIAATKEKKLASTPTAAATATTGADRSMELLVKKYLSAFSESKICPAQIKPHLVQFTPKIATGAQKIVDLLPILQQAYAKLVGYYELLAPYKPELLIPSLIGFVLCFFGGSFLTIIAAVEAFKMVGYDHLAENVKVVADDVKKIVMANAEDDLKDEDNDGTADVLQISNAELVKRKMLMALRTIDPRRVGGAVAALNAGFLAILATLKLQFAKTVTLGNSIAEMIEAPVDRLVVPKIEPFVPVEYRKWIKPTLSYAIRTVSISAAWFLQRIISAVHSALRGGLMFSRNILVYLKEMKIYELDHENTYLDEIVGYGLAALGLLFQLVSGFSLPFPLNLLLFPATALEYILVWLVAKQ